MTNYEWIFKITRRLSKPIRRTTNRRFVFYIPNPTWLRFHNKKIQFAFAEFKGEETQQDTDFSKLNVHRTYEKNRKDRILVEFSLNLQRRATFNTISQLLLIRTNYRKTIICNNKVSLNTPSTANKQTFTPKSSHRSKLSEELISYNELL